MPLSDYLPSRNTVKKCVKKWFLVGSNTLLNIATPLAVLDHIASTFNVDESTGEVREKTRLVIVGIYAALTIGMEIRSAKRTTEEAMTVAGSPEDEKELGDGKSLEGRRWHNNALLFDSWYKTIGKSAAAVMVTGELGAGQLASTLTGVGLGFGGYLHAQHPRLHPADIIHRVDLNAGPVGCSWGGLMSLVLRVGDAASAVDNAGRYITAYKIAAHQLSDIFRTSDMGPYLDDHVLFWTFAVIASLSTIYSKFLLARNRSADIWQKHMAARSCREWLRLVDWLAVAGVVAHSVAAYCNDRFLTEDLLPDWLSLSGSIVLPVLGGIGTYATNANYLAWEINDQGILVRRPADAPRGYQRLPVAEDKGSVPEDRPANVIYEVRIDDAEGGEVLMQSGEGAPSEEQGLLTDPERKARLKEELKNVLVSRRATTARDTLVTPSKGSAGESPDSSNNNHSGPSSVSGSPAVSPRPVRRPNMAPTLNTIEEGPPTGRPNANLSPPAGPAQVTAWTPPVSPPLSPQPVAEAKGGGFVGQWFRFLGTGNQPTSTTSSLLGNADEAVYGAVPSTEDSEKNPDQEGCILQ